MKIRTILFSKDRAMQLDATLRSFFLHCLDAEKVSTTCVVYKASNERYARQYNELSQMYPDVEFLEQRNFRQDLIENMAIGQFGLLKGFLYNLTARIGSIGFSADSYPDAIMRRFFDAPKIFALKMLLSNSNQKDGVLFLVDDNIFVKNFLLIDMLNALVKCPKAIGFSLRLGRNTQYCYSMRKQQSLPDFEIFMPKVLKYNWMSAESDFSYPLEISSSLYLVSVITPIILSMWFEMPNELEHKIAARKFIFKNRYPELLCFDRSVTFCNPINMVQSVYTNRAGEQAGLSVEYLAKLFSQGKRVNIQLFDGFVSNACHQEVELTFEDRQN